MAENKENQAAASGASAGKAAGSKSSLFREKSLERLESPEKLNDYLRVTSRGVWLVLARVIVGLIGGCRGGVCGEGCGQ